MVLVENMKKKTLKTAIDRKHMANCNPLKLEPVFEPKKLFLLGG